MGNIINICFGNIRILWGRRRGTSEVNHYNLLSSDHSSDHSSDQSPDCPLDAAVTLVVLLPCNRIKAGKILEAQHNSQ